MCRDEITIPRYHPNSYLELHVLINTHRYNGLTRQSLLKQQFVQDAAPEGTSEMLSFRCFQRKTSVSENGNKTYFSPSLLLSWLLYYRSISMSI